MACSKVLSMYKPFFYVCIIFSVILLLPNQSYAVWLWTSETNKWINPKNALKDNPDEQLAYALDFYQAEDYAQVIKECKKFIKNYPKVREAAEAQFYIAESLNAMGRIFDSFREYQKIVDIYPFSNFAEKVVDRQFKIGMKAVEDANEKKSFFKIVTGDWYDIVEIFRQVITNSPYGKFAAEAQYRIGIYFFDQKEYQQARDEFEKTLNDYPDTKWAKHARYQIAVVDDQRSAGSAYDQGVTKSAIKGLREIMVNNPNSETFNNAKDRISALREKEAENNFIIAEFYEKQKNYRSAKIYYQTIVDEYSDSLFVKKSLMKLQNLIGRE